MTDLTADRIKGDDMNSRIAYIVPTGYGFVSYAPVPGGGWFNMRWPNRAIAEKWEARQTVPVVWTDMDFYGRLPWERESA